MAFHYWNNENKLNLYNWHAPVLALLLYENVSTQFCGQTLRTRFLYRLQVDLWSPANHAQVVVSANKLFESSKNAPVLWNCSGTIAPVNWYLQWTISITRLLTDGGIPLLAMHSIAPMLSRSARDIENEEPLMLCTTHNRDEQQWKETNICIISKKTVKKTMCKSEW